MLIYKALKKFSVEIALLKNKMVVEGLLIYAFIWMLVTMVALNDLPRNLFELAP